MKGRHVVILLFAFGLALFAVLFRVLPGAAPAPKALPPPVREEVRPPLPPPNPETEGSIEAWVRSQGSPVPGAIVNFQAGDRPPVQQTTDAEGRCRVARASAGTWRIVARTSGVAASSTSVVVEPGRNAVVQLEMAAAVRIEGVVRDGVGTVVPGAKVALALPDPVFTTRTDAQGRYAISGIPPGVHSATASSERLRPQTRTDLDLNAPGQVRMVDFVLAFGTTLEGWVEDDAGRRLSKATVTATNEVARVVRTDGNGAFRVDGLGDSPVTVRVGAKGFATWVERGVAPGRGDLVVRMARGSTVRGLVSPPPPSFIVHLRQFDAAGNRFQLISSKSFPGSGGGVFQFEDLAAGRYQAVVETKELQTAAPLEFTLGAGESSDLGTVVLNPK